MAVEGIMRQSKPLTGLLLPASSSAAAGEVVATAGPRFGVRKESMRFLTRAESTSHSGWLNP
jgi:hypothetical protein